MGDTSMFKNKVQQSAGSESVAARASVSHLKLNVIVVCLGC